MALSETHSNTLFVTAALVDEDDLAMDSPHPHITYSHPHPGGPGSPGPGAIGQPTTVYTQTLHPTTSRKEDDLGLTNLLAQVRFDRNTIGAAGGQTEYGGRTLGGEQVGSRWDDWGRSSSRGIEAVGNGVFGSGAGVGAIGAGPRTAPLFPSSSSDHHLSTLHNPSDPAAQAVHHMNALQTLLGPMTRAVDEVEKLKKEVEMWKNDWHKVGEEKRGLERALNEAQAEIKAEKDKVAAVQAEVKPVSGLSKV